MGCCNSVPEEKIELLPYCEGPNVSFSEQMVELNGNKRNTASWTPQDKNNIKAVIIVCHGLNEHSLAYYSMAIPLAQKGYAVHAIDHVGHGHSDGKKGLISNYHTLVDDFTAFAITINDQYNSSTSDKKKVFIFAHSMGTLVTLMSIERLPFVQSLIFSGCALVSGPGASSPFGITCLYPLSQTSVADCLLSITSCIDPYGLAAPLVLKEVTNSAADLNLIRNDARRFKPIIMNKTAFELIKMIKVVKSEKILALTKPFLCFHGAIDTICLSKGTELLYNNSGTFITSKKMEIIPNCKHEIIHEVSPYKEQIIEMIVNYYEIQYHMKNDSQVATSNTM